MNKRTFVTIFPNYTDSHFYKDPGQITFRVSGFNFDSKLACFTSGKDFAVSDKNLKIDEIPIFPGKKGRTSNLLYYVFKNRKTIDVLCLFHISWQSLFISWAYKFLRRNGFVYLKMDNCHYSGKYLWEDIFNYRNHLLSFRGILENNKSHFKYWLINKYFARSVDLWSVEDEASRRVYEDSFPVFEGRIITLFNGHSADLLHPGNPGEFKEKEKIILSVGRLGTFQKATEVLLESFKIISPENDYQLHLAGSLGEGFDDKLDVYLKENPELVERVFNHGLLAPKELYNLYDRSRILCMPSRFEGLALVFCEAMFFRNAIVTTPHVSVRDLVMNERCGIIVNSDDPRSLAEALINLIAKPDLLEQYGENARKTALERFDWRKIIEGLIREIDHRTIS